MRPCRTVRFGTFEIDFEGREVRKQGLKLKLQEKPFQILEMLVCRSGQLVKRQEIRERLWPDTYVDFEGSLNVAVSKLRRLLGDTRSNPRFVETVPLQGYRFIASVETHPDLSPSPSPHDRPVDTVAVLPFHDSGGERGTDSLCDGITESLLINLTGLPNLKIVPLCSVLPYKGRDIDPKTVGSELKVRAIVLGRMARLGKNLMVSVELVDAEKGWRLWGEKYHGRLGDLPALQERILAQILSRLHLRKAAGAPLEDSPKKNHLRSIHPPNGLSAGWRKSLS